MMSIVADGQYQAETHSGMERIVEYVTLGLGVIGALVILFGVGIGLVELIRAEFGGKAHATERPALFEDIRYDIGFHILLGLEFLIAADIIRTIIRPNLEELAILGGLVLIRTVISYFLGREIGHGNEKKN
jgi:uncharacterized membrane protein